MNAALRLDRDALARACARYGVNRLTLFGSAVDDRFDLGRSDVDLLVEFGSDVDDLLGNYLDLRSELEEIFGRPVDLVMSDAVENPYFAAEVSRSAEEIYET